MRVIAAEIYKPVVCNCWDAELAIFSSRLECRTVSTAFLSDVCFDCGPS